MTIKIKPQAALTRAVTMKTTEGTLSCTKLKLSMMSLAGTAAKGNVKFQNRILVKKEKKSNELNEKLRCKITL